MWMRLILAAAMMVAAVRGVSADPMRACALYHRATGKPDNPFSYEAMMLFGAVVARGEQFNQECQALANIGFDNGFEPATFNLGPEHWVEWTLTGATVTYQGRTKREEMVYAMSGARFLPLRYTELATGPLHRRVRLAAMRRE